MLYNGLTHILLEKIINIYMHNVGKNVIMHEVLNSGQ